LFWKMSSDTERVRECRISWAKYLKNPLPITAKSARGGNLDAKTFHTHGEIIEKAERCQAQDSEPKFTEAVLTLLQLELLALPRHNFQVYHQPRCCSVRDVCYLQPGRQLLLLP